MPMLHDLSIMANISSNTVYFKNTCRFQVKGDIFNEYKYISSSLLWLRNPRDTLSGNCINQYVISRGIIDNHIASLYMFRKYIYIYISIEMSSCRSIYSDIICFSSFFFILNPHAKTSLLCFMKMMYLQYRWKITSMYKRLDEWLNYIMFQVELIGFHFEATIDAPHMCYITLYIFNTDENCLETNKKLYSRLNQTIFQMKSNLTLVVLLSL